MFASLGLRPDIRCEGVKRVVAIKLVNIVILKKNGKNDYDEWMHDRNKEKKMTDTVLSALLNQRARRYS